MISYPRKHSFVLIKYLDENREVTDSLPLQTLYVEKEHTCGAGQ